MLLTIELGATLPIAQFGNVKPLIRIEEIDPTGDVEEQIRVALEVSGKAFLAIDGEMERIVHDLVGAESGEPTYKARLETTEKSLKDFRTAMVNFNKRLKVVEGEVVEGVESAKKDHEG